MRLNAWRRRRLRARLEELADALEGLQGSVAESHQTITERLDSDGRKLMGYLVQGIGNHAAALEAQGEGWIDLAARVAAIETLLAHSRRAYGAHLKRLYERARADLIQQRDALRAAQREQAQAAKNGPAPPAKPAEAPPVRSDPADDLNAHG